MSRSGGRATTGPRRLRVAGVLIALASVALVAAVAGCSAVPAPVPSPTTSPTDSPAPSIATPGVSLAPTPAGTDTPNPTDVPAATDTPAPSNTPLPTVAGKELRWSSVTVPAALAAASDSPFQNALFGWSRGYVAFHENVDTGSAVPWASPDGRDWHKGRALDVAGLAGGGWVEEVVEGPAGLLALGRAPGCADDGSGCMPEPATALWTSADGLSWDRVDLKAAFGAATVADVSAGSKGYLAVGATADAVPQPGVWLSADGLAWQAAPLPPAAFQDAYLARATVLGSGYLIAGRIGSLAGWGGGYFPSTTPAVWWSADGSGWSLAPLPKVAAAAQAEAAIAVVAAGKLVAHVVRWDCACAPDGVTQAWSSSDGRAWKAAGGTFPSTAVVLSDGRQALQLVDAGGVLTMAISPDGFKWSQIAESGPGPADSAAAAYGPEGMLVAGTDGSLWLPMVTGAG